MRGPVAGARAKRLNAIQYNAHHRHKTTRGYRFFPARPDLLKLRTAPRQAGAGGAAGKSATFDQGAARSRTIIDRAGGRRGSSTQRVVVPARAGWQAGSENGAGRMVPGTYRNRWIWALIPVVALGLAGPTLAADMPAAPGNKLPLWPVAPGQ